MRGLEAFLCIDLIFILKRNETFGLFLNKTINYFAYYNLFTSFVDRKRKILNVIKTQNIYFINTLVE